MCVINRHCNGPLCSLVLLIMLTSKVSFLGAWKGYAEDEEEWADNTFSHPQPHVYFWRYIDNLSIPTYLTNKAHLKTILCVLQHIIHMHYGSHIANSCPTCYINATFVKSISHSSPGLLLHYFDPFLQNGIISSPEHAHLMNHSLFKFGAHYIFIIFITKY